MTRMRLICASILLFFIPAFTTLLHAGELRVRHALGGQPESLLIHGDSWYQSLGDRLVIFRKNGDGQLATRMLTRYPAAASCSDLLIFDNKLYALLDGNEVVVLDILSRDVPDIVNRFDAEALGIVPRGLVMVGDWPVVFGEGGAVRLNDGSMLLSCDERVTGVSMSMGRGFVYAVNNRLVDADTGEIIGDAISLIELDDDANAHFGASVKVSDSEGDTRVSLMDRSMREINNQLGNVTVGGKFRNIWSRKSRLIVSTMDAVYIIGIAPDELRLLRTLDIQGVHDVDVIGSNYLAVCGDFGSGVYRIEADGGGEGGQLLRLTPSVGELEPGVHDTRGVYIPSTNGSIYYGFQNLVVRSVDSVPSVIVPTEAIVLGLGGQVHTDPIFQQVLNVYNSKGKEIIPLTSRPTTIVAIDGNFWVGTHNGVVVFGRNDVGGCVEIGSIQLAGPIVQLIPLFDGSAAFISKCGMFGVIERVQSVSALEQ